MSTKKAESGLSLPEYMGLVSRVCDRLGIVPAVRTGERKTDMEFQALCDWCQERMMEKQKRERAINEGF